MSHLEGVFALLTEGRNREGESALATIQPENEKCSNRWQKWINDTLNTWQSNPTQLEDDGLEAPSLEVIHFTQQIATRLRDADWPAPLRIVPNGEGGILFEWRSIPDFFTLEIEEDLSVEWIVYHDSQVQHRERLSP